jgi:hypothetical protein
MGIDERSFWEMTLGELERAIESKRRVLKAQMQERATFDYIHADLVGRSVARVYNSANTMPAIQEVYAAIFEDNEHIQEMKQKKQEQLAELSAIRFKLFADSHNKKFKEVQTDK